MGTVTKTSDPGPESRPAGRRASTLVAALRRINATLDLDTVLREVLAGARALTGARKGFVVVLDEDGRPGEPVFSGLTPQEEREQRAWPGSLRLFEHLRTLGEPLRAADFPAYVRKLGIESPWTISKTFQGMPMRHRDTEVGNFSLSDKADGETFTAEDEEVLALFATQAATAIANARAHERERRAHERERHARADLEALIETSPIGVVVFDAKTGRASFNREARRIVEGLRTPGCPPEQLLQVMSFRRGDGREASLSELPITQQLASGERVRAEEMVLSVPDGRSVRTLVDATPIPGEGGGVGSVVATFQDLAPLDEIERLRTEFLALVSHELRGPLAAIKGSATTLLEEEALDPAEAREFHRLIAEHADAMRNLLGDLLDAGRIESGTLSVAPEPAAVADLVERARRTFLGTGAAQPVVVDLEPDLPPVMADRRRIAQVLTNLLANAAREAPGSAAIHVSAAREDAHVVVSVADQGPGLTQERLAQLFRKHTALGAGGRAGGVPRHGLGLAICKGLVEAHGGRIRAESAGPGHGTTVVFTLPAAYGTGAAGDQGRPDERVLDADAATRILVLDDDPRTLRLVREALEAEGYAAVVTADPGEVAGLLRDERPALALLDLALPDVDGIELMHQLPELAELPVIFISAYGRDDTVAKALDAGAADYIVKPFSPTELAARVRAALRRRERPASFELGTLAIDYAARRVTVAGRRVDLTPTEYAVLRVLSLNAGRVVPFEALVRRVWVDRVQDKGGPNLVRMFVRNLRLKLGEDAARPALIFNERGVGYRMPDPGET